MFLKNNHIFLRALEPTDLDIIYGFENDMSVWKVSNTLTPFSKYSLETYVNSAHNDIYTNKQLRLMICNIKTQQCIGSIDLFDFDITHSRIGVGIIVLESYRKQGFAKEALQIIITYIFETLMLHQIYCNMAVTNTESLNLFENLGFKKIGIKKHWLQIAKNKFEDEWMLQLINL